MPKEYRPDFKPLYGFQVGKHKFAFEVLAEARSLKLIDNKAWEYILKRIDELSQENNKSNTIPKSYKIEYITA